MQIITPERIAGSDIARLKLGGKAENLIRMQQAGFPVPPFLVIPCTAVNQLLNPVKKDIEVCIRQAGNAPDEALIHLAENIRQYIWELIIPAGFESELLSTCGRVFGLNARVAVRSSAAAEDSAKTSFAGIHASFLFVEAVNLIEKIKETIASAWSPGALKYRLIHQIPIERIEMAVIIQQMVDATKSGVSFSKNLDGNLADMVVVAGYGLGEGIVADKVETDTFIVDLMTRTVEKRIARKQLALVYQPGKGCVTEPLTDKTLQDTAALQDGELFEVCRYTALAESLLRVPADLEFSYDREGRLFILQMRPVTTLHAGEIKILDNTNIIESYPGITLPLSFSFAVQAYETVFRNSARSFLISAAMVQRLSGVFKNLLAHCYGRVYYRLDNWYRMMSLVHGSQQSVQAWEKAVGLTQGESAKIEFSFWRKVKTTLVAIWLLIQYPGGNALFFRRFNRNYRFLRQYSTSLSSPVALWQHYETAAARLFRPWHLTLINDFLAFKAFGWLQDLVRTYGIDENAGFANDLLCGTGGIESETAVLRVLELKATIQADPDLTALFLLPEQTVLAQMKQERYKVFYDLIEDYLDRYGDRTLSELKLETPSLRRHPEQFIRLLKQQLASPVTAADFKRQQIQIREKAESRVAARLKWWQPRTLVFKMVRLLAAYGLKSRENMRFCRARAYGAVKDVFLKIGQMMVQAEVIETPEDVFYLELAELQAFCATGEHRISKKEKVRKLKAEFSSYAGVILPDRIMYIGETLPVFGHASKTAPAGSALLRGIAVSKGVLQAEAVVISTPELDAAVNGRILVTPVTDPGWVFLMARAAGLVSEKGSLLSHTAIVGRELGIPVVVGVTGATTRIKTGDLIVLDGNAGTVELPGLLRPANETA